MSGRTRANSDPQPAPELVPQSFDKQTRSNQRNFLEEFKIHRFFRGYQISYAVLLAVLIIQVGLAYILGRHFFETELHQLFNVVKSPRHIAAWAIIPLFWIAVLAISLLRKRSPHPIRKVYRWIRIRKDWLFRGLLIIAAYPTVIESFSVLKSTIPFTIGFYADHVLLRLDRAILGQDAWKLSHAVAPVWFLIFIDRFYVLWYTYLAILTGVFSFTRDARLQIQTAMTFFLTWLLLGFVMASVTASVGPAFYDRFYNQSEFDALRSTLESSGVDLFAFFAMQYVGDSIGEAKFGGGISAMPSMHVAIAFLGFMVARDLKVRWLLILTAIFTILTWIGSVHLGWHYFTDGLVSIGLVYLIWLIAGSFVDRTRIVD